MSATPMIDRFLAEYAPDSRMKSYKDVSYLEALAGEIRTLTTPAPVERRLRTVKFSDGYTHRWNGDRLEFLVFNEEWHVCHIVPIPDIGAFTELRASPHLPPETVDDILIDYAQTLSAGRECRHEDFVARLRSAVRAERAPARGEGVNDG